jgi:uncharacterized protein YgiM (DUF1202 family)
VNEEKEEIFGASTSVEEPEVVTNEPTPEDPTVDVDPIVKTGVVVACQKLNVREHPDKNANVVSVLDEGSVVEVSIEESVSGFYKVCTEIGIEGYCMKSYIELA